MSSQSSASRSASVSQSNCLDPLDSLVDLSEFENMQYNSPSLSPSSSKMQFTSRPVANTPPTLPSSSKQTLSGPSHRYDLYHQQTGIPQGAVASTLAVNASNVHLNQFNMTNDYLSGLSPADDFIDFGTAPSQTPYSQADMEMDIKFESPSMEPAFFFPDQNVASDFIDPSTIGQATASRSASSVASNQSRGAGRLWPGMHQQQAALAKAQQQQAQQQQVIRQQQRRASAVPSAKSQRSNGAPATDPLVEEKIQQLLNSMRQSSVSTNDDDGALHTTPSQRMRKDEEDMDEDERLLASEEGKKLSSKERRQLRNKVSARAFRSRRKEYIGQLEGEIAGKINENADLRAQNKALLEENTRLSDLTRMLLSSPSFSGFLDTLSANSAAAQQPQPVVQAPAPQVENRQVRKDVNPYTAQNAQMHQHIGMTMIPEQPVDFSMLDLGVDNSFSYQPQVFSVMSIPETVIDSEILSGKSHSLSFASEDEKVELPVLKRMTLPAEVEVSVEATTVVDEEFDADPAFVLYASVPDSVPTSAPLALLELETVQLLAGIQPEKAEARIELVTEVSSNVTANLAMAKVLRLCESLDAATARLEALTVDL